MKLENVNVAKLQLADLPSFDKCPCELCDDGCFDRIGYQHHPECRRRTKQRSKLPLATRCPLTHYQATFQPTVTPGGTGQRRRSPCRPPSDNDIPIAYKHGSMSGVSAQRHDYQPPPAGTIKQPSVQPVKNAFSSLLARTVPMETQSHYQVEFVEKPVIPVSLRPLKDPLKDSHLHLTEPTAPMSSQTTTGSHFKSWHSAPSRPFTELPTVAGHVLFPGSSRNFDTTAASTFIKFPNPSQAKPVFRLEQGGHLRNSGSMDMRTVYRDNFIPLDPTSARNTPAGARDVTPDRQVFTRYPMIGVTQNSIDFRPYPNHRLTLPAEMEPFQSQITLGSPLDTSPGKSAYREDYPGHDTNRHHRQPAAAPKDHNRPYVAPVEKMEVLTVTHRDFQPLDIASLPNIRLVPVKPTIAISDQAGPMESVSMSRYHYQPYEPIKSNRRYGEPMPTFYIPPKEKFEGTTTSGETFQGRPGERARVYRPEIRMINRMGEHDHNTLYRTDYKPHGLSLCAAQAYAIAQQKDNVATPIPA